MSGIDLNVEKSWNRLDQWLFRECNAGTRRHLFAIFGLPVDEINNHGTERHALRYVRRMLTGEDVCIPTIEQSSIVAPKFPPGTLVQKSRGSNWRGTICGTYSTTTTPIGYAVESSREPGNVQIYPEAALVAWDGEVDS